ncbi:hypothetical protein ACHAWO_006642 [Cyclotella atomus]|uniref:Trafficking protein particle complex subunit 6B n=1 Tax=Cyclotella atomus TaxID=382360 RepID=A0ABD3QAV4_9STRA
MATTAPPLSSPAGIAPLPPNPTPNRPSSAPNTSSSNQVFPAQGPPSDHVSEPAYEFLLSEIIQWVERDEKRVALEAKRVQQMAGDKQTEEGSTTEDDAAAVMAAERSAARIERMGYDVGYRLCERLAQHRPLLGPGSPSPESGDGFGSVGGAAGGNNNPLVMGGGGHHTVMDPKTQLEAVKFLCKEFWTEVFRKQIDKLQTNHRGVFVLKDLELKWLRRLPPDEESARVGAIRILAFPCGLIRGALACLGLSGAVVSCDFLADGKSMASCSFNIKVK